MEELPQPKTNADDERDDRNWFTSIMEYTVRRETDDDAAVGASELEQLAAAFCEERSQSLKEIATKYPEITTTSVELLEKEVDIVYPQAHELWNVLKHKRHLLENSLIKEAEEYNQHLRDLRENLAGVEATIEVFDHLKAVHTNFVDAKLALSAKDFLKCVDLLGSAGDELLGFSDDASQNIMFVGEIKQKLQNIRKELLQQLEKTWKTSLKFSLSATGRSSRDRIEIVFGEHTLFVNAALGAFRLNMLDRLIRNTSHEVLNNVVAPLFDAESSPVLNDERRIDGNNVQLLISFPADVEKSDSLTRACTVFEILYTITNRLLQFFSLNYGEPTSDVNRDLTAAGSVFRRMLSEVFAVPLMQELVVEKCLQAFSTSRAGGTATKQRMQKALTNLYELFLRFDVACGNPPDLSMTTNLINRNVIDTACDEFRQRARRAVLDGTLFRNGRTVRIVADDPQTPMLVGQMLATVQLAVGTLRESSQYSSIMPSIQFSSAKQSRHYGAANTQSAPTAASEFRMQTSAALQELSVIADDILAACGHANSQEAINAYVRTVCDVYDAYLDLSSEMTSNLMPNADDSQCSTVAAITFCSCAFYSQILPEVKIKVEEVLKYNDAAVMGNVVIDNNQWQSLFDNRSRTELLPKALICAESLVRVALQHQVDAVNRILTNSDRSVRSAGTAAASAPGETSNVAAAKLMKAATWLKQQPAAAALSTAASSLAASAKSSVVNAPEMRALVDGAALATINDHIETLKTEWFAIMPARVALAMLSAVVDIVLGKLGSIVFRQRDITADDATAIAQNFKLLARKLMLLYKTLLGGEAPTRHCTRWDWFNELTFVLEASMGDIDDRWSDGQGPLALHFGASQVMLLVRVLFENNDRRQRLLDKLELAAAAERQ